MFAVTLSSKIIEKVMDCINQRPLLNIPRVYIHWFTYFFTKSQINQTKTEDRTKVTEFDWNVLKGVGMDLLGILRGSSRSYCTAENFAQLKIF